MDASSPLLEDLDCCRAARRTDGRGRMAIQEIPNSNWERRCRHCRSSQLRKEQSRVIRNRTNLLCMLEMEMEVVGQPLPPHLMGRERRTSLKMMLFRQSALLMLWTELDHWTEYGS